MLKFRIYYVFHYFFRWFAFVTYHKRRLPGVIWDLFGRFKMNSLPNPQNLHNAVLTLIITASLKRVLIVLSNIVGSDPIAISKMKRSLRTLKVYVNRHNFEGPKDGLLKRINTIKEFFDEEHKRAKEFQTHSDYIEV